jgi:hypothetical protein
MFTITRLPAQDANPPFNRIINGKIENNTVGTFGIIGSGSNVGNGIRVANEGAVPINILINNNTVQEVQSFPGISIAHGITNSTIAGGNQQTNVTITNNTVRNIGSRGIVVQDNANFGLGGNGSICANIFGNNLSGIAGQAGNGEFMRLRRLNGTFNVVQTSEPNLEAVNTLTCSPAPALCPSPKIDVSGTVTFGQPACLQPNN